MKYDLLEIHEIDVKNKLMEYILVAEMFKNENLLIDDMIKKSDYFLSFVHLWSAIEINLDDIKRTLKEYAENHQGTLKSSRDKKIYFSSQSEIMSRVNNFLSSANLFLSFLEKNTTNKTLRDEWNIKKRELHRQNINYRLCYELRNHSQHNGLPISGIEVNNIDSQEDVYGVIYLEKNSFADDDVSTKKLREYINEYKSDVDLILAFESYTDSIAELFQYFITQHQEYYDNICNFYDSYSKITLEDPNGSLVYVSNKVPKERILLEMTRLRLAKFKYVIEVIGHVNIKVSRIRSQ